MASPDTAMLFSAATGAACIGWVALSTTSTASAASSCSLVCVESAAADFGVCPSPSPSIRTSFGAVELQRGTNGPLTRIPLARSIGLAQVEWIAAACR